LHKTSATVLTLAAFLIAMASPVLLVIQLANRQARQTELSLVTGYANDVLHRSETTSDQALADAESPIAAHSADPCSDSNIAIMRRFDLASSYLQAVGYVVDGHWVCSSQGRDGMAVRQTDVDG
jgi:sensor c-di-GMP phosphodiesterase-like protein